MKTIIHLMQHQQQWPEKPREWLRSDTDGQCSCRRARGFTLIELMAVLVVILILAGIGLTSASFIQRKTAVSRVRADMAAIENALEVYKSEIGYYPSYTSSNTWSPPQDDCVNGGMWSSVAIYRALAGVDGGKQYLRLRSDQVVAAPGTNTISGPGITNVIDTFGQPYRYRAPGSSNKVSFDLWSLGPDRVGGIVSGVNKDLDNITNWQ